MQSTAGTAGKKEYTTPRLTAHGTLEDVTRQNLKTYGSPADGLVLGGQTLTTVTGSIS
jgi:hypothetical protein